MRIVNFEQRFEKILIVFTKYTKPITFFLFYYILYRNCANVPERGNR
jgi:hypothetical protein